VPGEYVVFERSDQNLERNIIAEIGSKEERRKRKKLNESEREQDVSVSDSFG